MPIEFSATRTFERYTIATTTTVSAATRPKRSRSRSIRPSYSHFYSATIPSTISQGDCGSRRRRRRARGETGGGTSRRNTNIREWRFGLRTPLEGAADIRGGGTRGGALRRTNTESGRRDVRTRVRGSYGKSVRGVRGCRTAEGGDERGCREARRRGRADDAEYGEGVRRGGRAAARRDRDDAELDRRGCIIRHRKREVARRKFSRIGARPTTFVGGERMRFANRVRSGWGGRRRGSRRRMISRGRACVIRTRALRRLPRKRRSTK
mmetsp:Transcript_28681/g.52378  ORF Transcript_28681/g.52378 Transcript_28681/m.52378 type:complete len:266 (-) Transcript_28681:457-1254(-)